VRALLAIAAVLAVLVVLAVIRAAFDDGRSVEEQRCHDLRIAANAVTDREDTTDDEVEYLRRARAAEKACAEAE
jgi:sensor c-di-GMP phosphodiesterase-like protein